MMGYYGFGWFGMIFNLAILIGIVALIVWAFNRFSSGSRQSTGNQSPREILQARYARGEITREQYQQMLTDLG